MTKGRLLATIVFTLLLVVGVISALVLAKGDAWKEFAVESVNENINTHLEVGDVDISVWSTLPQISIILHDVTIEGAKNRVSDDPSALLKVDRLGLAFSLWDILFGEPVIRSLTLDSGEINLEKFASGKWNAEILTGESEGSNIDITTILLNNIDFSLLQNVNLRSSVFVSEATIREGVVELSFDDLLYGEWSETLAPLYGDLKVEYSIDDSDEVNIEIKTGVINSLPFSCEINLDVAKNWSLEGRCSEVSQKAAEEIFNDPELLEGWSYGGRSDLSFSGNKEGVRVNFTLPESDFAVAPHVTGLALNNTGRLSASGSVVLNMSSLNYTLQLTQVKIVSNGLSLDFSADSKNVGNADLNLKGIVSLNLGSSYKSWLPELQGGTWTSLPDEGSIELRGEIVIPAYGKVSSPSLFIESTQMGGTLNSIPYSIQNLRMEYSDGALNVEELDFDWAGNVGVLSSKIIDFSMALDGGPIRGDLNITAESLVIDPILSWWDNIEDVETDDEINLLALGTNLDYSVTSGVLLWDALECKELSSQGIVSARRILISYASTKGLGGEATVQGSLRPGGPGWMLGFSGTVSSISLPDLFRVYDNFGQGVIRTEHLEGRSDFAGSMNLGWDKGGEWQSNSFSADLEITISNGRLLKLEMFDEVADYLKAHRLIAPLVDPEDLRSRLSDIEFDYLESPITIATSTVSVPFLKIQSSAMDVSIEGIQTFKGEIDYTLGFALRDLKNDKQGQFGNILDDGLGTMFFLGMGGTFDEPEYSYDREAHRANRRRALSAEAERIKNAIKGVDKVEEEDETPQVKTRKSPSDILDDPEDDDF